MNERTIKILSIALFALLLIWGAYTLIYYLGVLYHGAALIPNDGLQAINAACDANAFLCRGVKTFLSFLRHTFVRSAPFLWYFLLSLAAFGGWIGWRRFASGQTTLRIRWTPWKLLLLFATSVWLMTTVISFGSVNGRPVRFYPEPTATTYNVSEQGLAELQEDYQRLLVHGCLKLIGPSEAGALLYTFRSWCVQEAFVLRVVPQILFVVLLLFEFLILGHMILQRILRRGFPVIPSSSPQSGERIEGSPLMFETLFSVAIGACAWIVILWSIAIAGLFVSTTGWILAIAVPIAGQHHARYWVERFLHYAWEREYRWHDLSIVLGWLLCSYLALNFLEVVRPFPIGWDDLGSYLNRPRLLVSFGHFIHTMSPFDWTYLTSLGFLLFGYASPFGATASMMVNWSAGLLAVLSVFVFARTFLGKSAGFLSALLYYSLPLVGHFSFADMKIDNTVFFFGALGTLAVFLALFRNGASEESGHPTERRRTWKLLFLAGMFLGFAFATKSTAIMVLLALLAVVLGMLIHWFAFIAGLAFAFLVLSYQGVFSLGGILSRSGFAADARGLEMFFVFACVIVIAGVLAFIALRKRISLVPALLCSAALIGGFAAAIFPWVEHNNLQEGNVIPHFMLSAPNRISRSAEIDSLSGELAVNRSLPQCEPTGGAEELDRYWGFRHDWSHYLTLPWRTVMNLDATGYYVTTVPALLLVPLLLLLPFFWSPEGKWLRWLMWGTGLMLLQWVFLANGIPWYGVGILLGLVIGLEALVLKAPDLPNRILAGTLIAFSLLIAFNMRMWQFEQQRNIFEYSMGKASADVMQEVTIPHYDDISAVVMDRHETIPDRPSLYRIGTFIPYFIPRNLQVIGINDHQLDLFNCLHAERNPELTTKRLKSLGFNSLVFDTNTATIERDEQGSLHKKVNAFVDFVNNPVSRLQVVISDTNAGIAFILIP